MYGSFTIHICYITNFGPLEYCGVDNKPYRINDSEDNEDIYVSVEQFNNSTKYFMQINFRDITQDHTRKILWKTTPRQSLSYTVDILLLKEQNYELKNCEGQKFITYYYTNLLSNVSICVLIMSLANNQPCLQSTAYTQHGFANTSSKGISNVYISVNGSFVFIDVLNVTDYNFGRYDWTLTMCENTNIDYTFYLIHDTLDLPSSLCNGGNTNFSVEASRDSLLSICFRTFSHLDRTLSINNFSVPIVSSVKEFQKYNYTMSDLELNFKNISVFNNWNQQLDTRYIQILLVPTKSQEMKIEFVSSNRILVYNISLNGLKTDENEIWKNNGTNNTTREFTNRTDSQAKVKREKVETQLNLYTQGQRNDNNYINVDNQNDVMYMNLKTSRPRSLRLVANAPDLTKDLDERIYLNTCDLEQESSFIGIGDSDYKDPPSGRYISDEGLLYVTVSHDNSLRSANSSASSRHTDNVIYASLDLEKSGKIPLLQFKQPRIKQKKKISDKKTNLNDFTITSSSPSQVNS
uniref:Uncharacterized protein n=1 Tax=Biomphalaria glabrata TaxID=6526 RepID=A0A2C9K1F6_BIOGL